MSGVPTRQVLEHWRKGVAEFNGGRVWHAHEEWETGWNRLESPDRENVQALIQLCGVIHLVELGRMRGALALATRALELLPAPSRLRSRAPCLRMSGARRFLGLMRRALDSADPARISAALASRRFLRASVRAGAARRTRAQPG